MFIEHVLGLFIENKMGDVKKYFNSWTIFGSIAVAISLPWLAFKFMKAICSRNHIKQLVGKVVVITGASSGLGEALAHEFYKRGCQVVLCSRNKDELNRVKNDLLQKHLLKIQTHTPIVVPLDLADLNSIPEKVSHILSITGHVDILINNGGMSYRGQIIDTDIEVHKRVMTVNYFGTVALTKAILPKMIERKSGSIAFISSIQGLIAIPERSVYAASKHAMQAFADTLRAEIQHHNINVFVSSPGYIRTNLSVNAVTHSGDQYSKMDESTAKGYKSEFVAEEILKSIVEGKKEAVLAQLGPKMAVFLRHFCPSLYFIIMARRFRKEQNVQ